MDKDIDRIPKNPDTDIIIRIDDFGGKRGVTIREFVRGERYTGYTKAGTRIPVDQFKAFKKAINSIDEKELMEGLIGVVSNQKEEAGEDKAQMPKENTMPKTEKQFKNKGKNVKTEIVEENPNIDDIGEEAI